MANVIEQIGRVTVILVGSFLIGVCAICSVKKCKNYLMKNKKKEKLK